MAVEEPEEQESSGDFHALLLPFDVEELSPSEEREFVRAFEVGSIYTLLKFVVPDDEAAHFTMHIVNARMIMRVSEALHRPVRTEEVDDTWLEAYFEPVQA